MSASQVSEILFLFCLGIKIVLCTGLLDLANNTSIIEIRGYLKREHSLVKPYQGK